MLWWLYALLAGVGATVSGLLNDLLLLPAAVTSKFNELVYQYPIRIPERYSLVIRSLLTQEGICMTLKPEFHFLEVAYPYVARWELLQSSTFAARHVGCH
jgi:predicted unusual protein kinase regulating ubiquinone biosynthesis (AarF/ABC1/UbiB family)